MAYAMAEEPDSSWGGLPGLRRSTGATSPFIRPNVRPLKITATTTTRKEPTVVATTRKEPVVVASTRKEPVVVASTQNEPAVVATTARHHRLLGKLPPV